MDSKAQDMGSAKMNREYSDIIAAALKLEAVRAMSGACGEPVVGEQKVFEFRALCCSGSQSHIIIGVNPKGGGRQSQIRSNCLWQKGDYGEQTKGQDRSQTDGCWRH
jgi:hypothetical protein